jgi:hypothetical protein
MQFLFHQHTVSLLQRCFREATVPHLSIPAKGMARGVKLNRSQAGKERNLIAAGSSIDPPDADVLD